MSLLTIAKEWYVIEVNGNDLREEGCLWARCFLHPFCDVASRAVPASALA